MKIPRANNCLICKGSNPKLYCGRDFCPILEKARIFVSIKKRIVKESFSTLSPNIFVGHNFYPNVSVGILSPPEETEEAWLYDAPRYWAEHNFSIKQIVDFRSFLINSRFKQNVYTPKKFFDVIEEIAMASKPVDLEIMLKDKPKFKINFNVDVLPNGPGARLKRVKVTENPKIDIRVEKICRDEIKANDALVLLYKKGFDENFLTKLLSSSLLGLKKQRKLVPTRWSITAVDDIIAKNLMKEIKQYPFADYSAFFGSYLGNYYLILMFPEVYSYELFEIYAPKAEWNISNEVRYVSDYEPYEGRKSYAENCGGGFYSVRLALLEKLKKMKRQASCLVLRFVTDEYSVPLGVWVTREAARKALSSKSINFSNKELMLKYALLLAKKKFNIELSEILKQSILLRNIKEQKKLTSFV